MSCPGRNTPPLLQQWIYLSNIEKNIRKRLLVERPLCLCVVLKPKGATWGTWEYAIVLVKVFLLIFTRLIECIIKHIVKRQCNFIK